jgi:putative flippase GtrA
MRSIAARYGVFLKFCLVGAGNTAVTLLVYWLLLKLNVHYLIAGCLGYLAGMVNGYLLSAKHVFKSARSLSSALRFCAVNLSALIINLLLLFVFVDVLAFDPLLAQALATVINLFYNFTLNKIWTFKAVPAGSRD